MSLLTSHGARYDKKLAQELQRAQELLRKRQKGALYATIAFAAASALVLNPLATPALHSRTPWAMLLLAVWFVVELVWIIQIARLGKAWTNQRDLKKLR